MRVRGASRTAPPERGRERLSVAVIGSGFSGIGLAIRLREAGFDDLTVFEKAADLGGVWRDNGYPGAACDAPSHLYSYSFEPNPGWSRRFAPQPEILAYLRHCAARHRIGDHIRFNTEVTSADFDARTGRWRLRTATGATYTADLLVSACGQLSRPARPDLPGIDGFAGTVFHSAEWDHGHDLTGRSVAIVGNGASAVQIAPAIAPVVGALHVFQREPHWVGHKWDRAYPRWRRRLNRRFALLQKLPRLGVFLWFELLLNPMLVSRRFRPLLSAHIRAMCRVNLRSVRDTEVRRALTPHYELGCKRVLVSSDYYRTLNRPDVALVTSPLAAVTRDGLRTADGRHHRADTIILATGFRSHDFVAPMRITGLAGRDLADAWRNGAHAYLGMSVPGFPNFFLMYGPNTNVGSGSVVHMLESQIGYIVQAARLLSEEGVKYIDVRADVQEEFDRWTARRLDGTVWNAGGCRSWYLQPDARGAHGHRNASNWAGYMLGYRLRTRRLDRDGYRIVAGDRP